MKIIKFIITISFIWTLSFSHNLAAQNIPIISDLLGANSGLPFIDGGVPVLSELLGGEITLIKDVPVLGEMFGSGLPILGDVFLDGYSGLPVDPFILLNSIAPLQSPDDFIESLIIVDPFILLNSMGPL